MAGTRRYEHYCAVARTLDIVGGRWTLLVVRDLLRGPRRFSELRDSLHNITPRQLSASLAHLTEHGLVHRGPERATAYTLTPAGRALGPVVGALTLWGSAHVMEAPRPDEVVHPEHLLQGAASLLNHAKPDVEGPLSWAFRFTDTPEPAEWTLELTDRWRAAAGAREAPDVRIHTDARTLAALVFEPAGVLGPFEMLGSEAARLQLAKVLQTLQELT